MRKSLSHVMSATPTKVCKRGRKPKIDIVKNSSCRFYGVNFASGGGRASFENLFSPSGREESVGLILAEWFEFDWVSTNKRSRTRCRFASELL